ncbi:MAG TPA: DUF1579 family protein [Candidatus Eisenbacteria bacterium]|jgi:hypothetical protein
MKSLVVKVLVLASCFATAAVAQEASQPGMKPESMAMPTAGPESKALAKFFGQNLTWTGTCAAGAMGPDSKEMSTKGKAVAHPILGGLWYVCDVEDVYGSGKEAMTWKGHQVVGYDFAAKAYRAVMTDNMGMLTTWNGTLDGETFALETPEPVMMGGQMVKSRLTFAHNADGTISFKDEHQAAGGEWQLAESAMARPSGGKAKGEHMATSEKK